jgi:hypothetical protein
MIVKRITFFGQAAEVACDGRCSKAWGNNNRPRVEFSDNPDDYAFLADHELGVAPADPGTYEGLDGKPENATGPDDINRWCVRECERMKMTNPGEAERGIAPVPPDFSSRVYNMGKRRRQVLAGVVPLGRLVRR